MSDPDSPSGTSATGEPATVRDSPERSRYIISRGTGEAGYAEYERIGGNVVFTHTVIDPAFKGQGLGAELIRAALDDVRERGGRVVAQCSFVAGYLRRHPDYADLVAG